MTSEQTALLSKATGIPCHTEALVAKAKKMVLAMPMATLVLRVGDDAEKALAIAEEPVEDPVTMIVEDTQKVEGPVTTLVEEIPQPKEERVESALSAIQLDQMNRKELQALAEQHGMPTKGRKAAELRERLADFLGLAA